MPLIVLREVVAVPRAGVKFLERRLHAALIVEAKFEGWLKRRFDFNSLSIAIRLIAFPEFGISRQVAIAAEGMDKHGFADRVVANYRVDAGGKRDGGALLSDSDFDLVQHRRAAVEERRVPHPNPRGVGNGHKQPLEGWKAF